MRSVFANRTVRPYLLLVAITVVLWILDGGRGVFFTTSTAFSVLQQFATIGLIALGVGITMILREIDLSVAGMMSLSGCIAVLTGANHPELGVALAVLFGLVWGLFQGAIMVWLRLGSIGVTLGGLLTLAGLAYVVTGNLSISYPRMDVALAVNHPVLVIFSLRSLVALAAFLIAGFVMARTRVGRDVYATGSDRRAAMVAGVRTSAIIPAVFACSGMLAALAGSLLSYSLAAASGVALTDVLVPAIAAAIIGGVSLMGGRGYADRHRRRRAGSLSPELGSQCHRHATRRARRGDGRSPVPRCDCGRRGSAAAPVRCPPLLGRNVCPVRQPRGAQQNLACGIAFIEAAGAASGCGCSGSDDDAADRSRVRSRSAAFSAAQILSATQQKKNPAIGLIAAAFPMTTAKNGCVRTCSPSCIYRRWLW